MNILYLKKRFDEIYVVAPNDLGNPYLTRAYKGTTKFLKRMPFIFIIPLSFTLSIILYFLFGLSVIRLTSVLQNGF